MKIRRSFIIIVIVLVIAIGVSYTKGRFDGNAGKKITIVPNAEAKNQVREAPMKWSPTKPYPVQEVYHPGTEELKPDEMRVIALGSGMPMPRLKQAAAGFLIELGNGDKFVFDVGTGSFTTLYSLGIPLDYMTKIFISHQHADHMGDLPSFWIYGMQNGRSKPIEVLGARRGRNGPELGHQSRVGRHTKILQLDARNQQGCS